MGSLRYMRKQGFYDGQVGEFCEPDPGVKLGPFGYGVISREHSDAEFLAYCMAFDEGKAAGPNVKNPYARKTTPKLVRGGWFRKKGSLLFHCFKAGFDRALCGVRTADLMIGNPLVMSDAEIQDFPERRCKNCVRHV